MFTFLISFSDTLIFKGCNSFRGSGLHFAKPMNY